MGKIAKGVTKINFTMLYGNYCYIIIENFPQKFSPCTIIFNTASTMTNLSLNSQNQLFSCSGIGLLIGFLVFHLKNKFSEN